MGCLRHGTKQADGSAVATFRLFLQSADSSLHCCRSMPWCGGQRAACVSAKTGPPPCRPQLLQATAHARLPAATGTTGFVLYLAAPAAGGCQVSDSGGRSWPGKVHQRPSGECACSGLSVAHVCCILPAKQSRRVMHHMRGGGPAKLATLPALPQRAQHQPATSRACLHLCLASAVGAWRHAHVARGSGSKNVLHWLIFFCLRSC